MDQRVIERLYSFSDNFQENPDKASEDIYSILVKLSELLFKGQYEEFVEIKRLLDDELIAEKINDKKSYNLGKAHALIELGTLFNKYNRLKTIKSELGQEEVSILSLIKERKEVQFSDIEEALSFNGESISSLLSKLKNQGLVRDLKIGPYTLYQLTLEGLTILK